MTTKIDKGLPNASRLRSRFDELRRKGLRDLKFWFVGAPSENASVDDLCAEAMSILDAHEQPGRTVENIEQFK